MGIRVLFYLGPEDGLASFFLSSPLDQFEEWATEVATAPSNHGFETELANIHDVALIKDVLSNGPEALRAVTQKHAARVDKLIRLFLEFCSMTRLCKTKLADPAMLYVGHFRAAFETLRQSQVTEQTLKLWGYMLSGRPLLRDAEALPYVVGGSLWWVSYWTLAECRHLKQELSHIANEQPQHETRDYIEVVLRATATAIEEDMGLIISVS